MAVIGKIRKYSGLLIAIIGVGLAAFVLGDLFQYGGPQRGRGHVTEVGNIDGNPISYQEFDERYNQQLENWKQQTGIASPNRQQMFRVRQQVWDQLVQEILLEQELEKTGIDVSADELFDLVAGSDPHPFIIQSFTNPQTGEFNPAEVRNFIQNINHMDPSTRRQWIMIEQLIKNERKEEKYNNLIQNSIFVPEVFAKLDFANKNTSVDIRFLAKNYNTIPDEDIELSDRDLRRVYDENKNLFHQEHTIDLEYVVVNVEPTEKDREEIKDVVLELKEEIKEEENIERFINAVSDERFDSRYHSRGDLSPEIEDIMFDSPVGTVHGPYVEDNAFVVAMLNDVQFRPDSMSAQHILVTYRGSRADQQQQVARNYPQAQEKADSIFDVVRSEPGRFQQLAVEFSDDPSAAMNMGDLGWFKDGNMVPEFNEAVVSGNVGDIVKVETDFGFHIIQITGHSPASKKVQVAKIIRNIEPSTQTFRQVRADVSDFANQVRKERDFENPAKEKGYSVRQASHVGKMDNSIPGVREAREIIRWAYNEETKEGAISQVFNLQDKFVLAKISKIRQEGTPPLENIRTDIERIALKEKKFEKLSQDLSEAVSQHNSIERAAEQLNLEVHSAENLNFSTTNLPGFGREAAVIGKAVALKPNTISKPVKGNNAVFVIEIVNKTEAVTPDDLTAIQRQLRNNTRNRVVRQVVDALKKNADIEDNRTLFY